MWKVYRKTRTQEMRPYISGESLAGISISAGDTPEEGGMIARATPIRGDRDQADQWYISKAFFETNYEESPATDYSNAS